MKILIKNGNLVFENKKADILIEDGKIKKIAENISIPVNNSIEIIEANGNLVIPNFIDPHIHLDKVLVLESVRPNKSGTLREAIEILWEKKKSYTIDDIIKRAGTVIEWAVQNGTLNIRTHVDVDTIGGLMPLKGVLEVREKYKDIVDIQIVAFPQEGILKDPGTEELLYKAMELGADIVGGMPANEKKLSDSHKHIDIAFEIAKKFNADIDMHVDETDDPNSITLEYLADKTIEEKYFERVTADHTCALAAYKDDYAEKVIEKVAKAKMNMITNPATNLMLQGREDKQPKRRGITRVKELLQAGVNVTFGQDCIKDTFYPYGQADMLEVALITAHAAHLSLPNEIETTLKMCTYNAAKTLRLSNYGIKEGLPANLVVLNANSILEAIRTQPGRITIKNGKIIAKKVKESNLFKDIS
jgi:cytosine deaminase